ncbi:MAG: cytochrome c [Bacteroidales bacterium]|nr:cytochrome c [Bacteroidales bacterium]MCF8375098.1 cytochrome c [Bacteroidales bacterium]MCF8400005.1 cytochrome c [Bacteroidales bacterium]
MKLKRYIFNLLAAAGLLIMITSCDHDRNHPGWVYMPDMMYSVPYDAYSPNPVFSDSITMQPPVKGTIARGRKPYPFERTFQGQQQAGKELENQLEVSEDILREGKRQYDIFCAICHGEQGKGEGHLYTSKLFPAKPTSLVDDYVQNKPDGEIYHVITLGSLSGLMGAHGPQIKPEDRWKIVHYVKHELGKSN